MITTEVNYWRRHQLGKKTSPGHLESLKTFRVGTHPGHGSVIFGQRGEVGWLSWRSSSPRNFPARISVGPGPLGGVASVLPPGRPFSPLEHGNPRMGSLQSLPASPSPEQQRGGGSPHPRLVLRLALQPWLGSATLLSRCCQMLGCKRLRGAPGHTPEAGPGSSWRRTAPVGSRGWMQSHTWCTCPQPFAASSPLEDPDFVDGCQGGRHVGLKVPVVYPGLPKSPRRRVVLPVVVPVPFAVRPEAVQVHLRRAKQR